MAAPARPTRNPPCACGRPTAYAACCGRWHVGALHLQAPDAEALMRSRYSAFVMGLGAYLRDTWHPSTRPAQDLLFEPGTLWLGLQVKRCQVHGANHATVEFVARSKQAGTSGGGKAQRLHEISRFVREEGRWFYLDGDVG